MVNKFVVGLSDKEITIPVGDQHIDIVSVGVKDDYITLGIPERGIIYLYAKKEIVEYFYWI